MNAKYILSDALPKGANVRLTGLFGLGPREGTVVCGQRGVIRCIAMKATNGHYDDTGDTYIDEIIQVQDPATGEWRPFKLVDRHAKTMARIRAFQL